MSTCPTGKTAYPTRPAAEEVVKAIRRNKQQRQSRPKRAYRCEVCEHWHLTQQGVDSTRIQSRRVADDTASAREILDDIRSTYDGPLPNIRM